MPYARRLTTYRRRAPIRRYSAYRAPVRRYARRRIYRRR